MFTQGVTHLVTGEKKEGVEVKRKIGSRKGKRQSFNIYEGSSCFKFFYPTVQFFFHSFSVQGTYWTFAINLCKKPLMRQVPSSFDLSGSDHDESSSL